MSYWKYVSYLGTDSESTEDIDKGLILSNKINAIIFLIMLAVFILSVVETNLNNTQLGYNSNNDLYDPNSVMYPYGYGLSYFE